MQHAVNCGSWPDVSHGFFDVFLHADPPKVGQRCVMSPSCLESQGCHLIPLFYFLSCFFLPSPRALSVLSFFSRFSPQKTLKYFSLRVRLYCVAVVEQLGDNS